MSRHTTHRRHRASNDVVYRTASGGVLIAAGPPAAIGPGGGLAQRVARILGILR
jgi:hypothetical protein